ncbi:MAG TPA: peptide chain release factor-like protein [Opitutaceae bacterium]|nr:peptide chain release factor-like protein [Opitutaceae bacterium]
MHAAPGHSFQFLEDEALASRLAALGVRPDDCREQFILGSGPGGQKINKTASTVRVSHAPSGIDVRSQGERSRSANRHQAWSELADRLEAQAAAEKARVISEAELSRRQRRQKSRSQKVVMIRAKKHRAKIKGRRGRVGEE